jgi:hypothetical protein
VTDVTLIGAALIKGKWKLVKIALLIACAKQQKPSEWMKAQSDCRT